MSFKNKKRLCPISFVKAKAKERKKAFRFESAADPATSGKGFFYNQDECLWEKRTWMQIGHEWKPVGWNEFTEAGLEKNPVK